MIGENGDKVLQQPLECPSSKPVLLFINTVQWRHSEVLQQTIVPVPCQFSAVLYKKQAGQLVVLTIHCKNVNYISTCNKLMSKLMRKVK